MPEYDVRIAALRQQGDTAERAGDLARAARCFEEAGREYLLWSARGAPAAEAERKARARDLLERASRLRGGLRSPAERPEGPSAARREPAAGAVPGLGGGSAVDESIQAAVASFLMSSTVTWDDVAGLDEQVGEIQSALCMAFALYPEEIRLPRSRNVLFYGPPGTGKTLIASAVCSSLMDRPDDGAEPSAEAFPKFFNVSLAGLISKWVGDSSRAVAHLFEEAARLAPSVVFLDEFEAVTQRRSAGDSSHDRQVLSQVLTQLDGFANKGGEQAVIVIAATNRPWDMDEAVLSRFGRKFHIPLPDVAARAAILRVLVHKSGVPCACDLARLAADDVSRGYSGRDMRNWFLLTVQAMLREANVAPSLADAGRAGLAAMRGYALRFVPLTMEHFLATAATIYPQTTPVQVRTYEAWERDPTFTPGTAGS